MTNAKVKKYLPWLFQIITAVIILQTLYFKFSAHPDSVAIFEALGAEPFGRIGLGIVELIVGIALLTPRFNIMGAAGAFIIGLGAILSHLLVLGINLGDGGALFAMAITITVGGSLVLLLRKAQVKKLITR